MAVKKGYKRLTNREKRDNKEVRAILRKDGILPPVKPKLNRKKFVKDVLGEWKDHRDFFYLMQAINWIIPGAEFKGKITPEQIGALKVLKLAMEIKKFETDLAAKGETTYNTVDFYRNVVDPVLKL